ncbi:MAG: FAD-binding oxidoreductase [Gammaproteobacteria bacterium]|nr:FAD-binding oxidoreductase [Gammaproteobacteria bacterium]
MNAVRKVTETLDPAVVSDNPIDLLTYQRDCSVSPPGHAQAMVRPRDKDDVAAVLREATRQQVPVYVRGGGTMYAGGVNPHQGGLVLDLTGMNRILDIDLARGVVLIEPGVRFGALTQMLKPHGQTIGIIPVTGPTATIGGAASAHALGTGSARFQSFADEVVGLEVVLPSGQVIRTGSAAGPKAEYFHRFGMGPDLTGLFLGGDATFGVITAIALWLHPLPKFRDTQCYGFASAAAAANFIGAVQARELTRLVWYGSGYEAGTIKSRVLGAVPDTAPESLPQFCVGLDFGGDEPMVRHDQQLIATLCADTGGRLYPLFNESYFRHLRNEEIYWYGYAGYFSRSRCAILMSSLATPSMPAFLTAVAQLRTEYPQFLWGAAVVLCRRGLHGGIMAFYDEAREWEAAQDATQAATALLVKAGCTPYKTGKLWAEQLAGFTQYHEVLQSLKQLFDPQAILSPGNLGLGHNANLEKKSDVL